MQIPEPKFNIGDFANRVGGAWTYHAKIVKRTWSDNEGWRYTFDGCTFDIAESDLEVKCPFPVGSKVCYKSNPERIYTVREDGRLDWDGAAVSCTDWSKVALAPKFKIGDKLWHNVHGAMIVRRISWFESPNHKGTWGYNDNFECNLEYAKNVGPFKPGDRVACKNYPEKVGRVAENYDILIDLSAPKDVAGQVIPSYVVVWDAWAPAPKYKLPVAIKHKEFPDNVGYADSVVWEQDRWEYHGPEISGTFEENIIELNAEIEKIRISTAVNMEEGNQRIIELFLGEYKND